MVELKLLTESTLKYTNTGICTSKSLLPPQGILCIKIDTLLLCCFVVLLYYCKTQFSKLCVSQGNIPKNARIMIILMLYSSTTMSNYEPCTSL